jgi:hypothetical protein
MYLSGLSSLLAWDNIIMMISTRYCNDAIGHQAQGTLQRLVDLSNEEILIKSAKLLKQICEKMKGDIERYMEIFTKKEPKKVSVSISLFTSTYIIYPLTSYTSTYIIYPLTLYTSTYIIYPITLYTIM